MTRRAFHYGQNSSASEPVFGREAAPSASHYFEFDGFPLTIADQNKSETTKRFPPSGWIRWRSLSAASFPVQIFAWLHGNGPMATDGWAKTENRESNIGQMLGDGQMLDHIRTTGLMFRNRLVEKSREPFTLWVDQPVAVGDYNGLMRGKYNYKPGWQNVHGVRKAFGKVPESQATAPWMTQAPANPIVSDTGEIVKDTARKQLTVAAPQAEAFSGYFDDKAPAGLKHLTLTGNNFATVIAVAADGRPLAESEHVILSRTEVKADNSEGSGPVIRLAALKQPTDGKTWQLTLTRPRAEAKNSVVQKLEPGPDGTLVLDESGWRECELRLAP